MVLPNFAELQMCMTLHPTLRRAPVRGFANFIKSTSSPIVAIFHLVPFFISMIFGRIYEDFKECPLSSRLHCGRGQSPFWRAERENLAEGLWQRGGPQFNFAIHVKTNTFSRMLKHVETRWHTVKHVDKCNRMVFAGCNCDLKIWSVYFRRLPKLRRCGVDSPWCVAALPSATDRFFPLPPVLFFFSAQLLCSEQQTHRPSWQSSPFHDKSGSGAGSGSFWSLVQVLGGVVWEVLVCWGGSGAPIEVWGGSRVVY